MLVKEVILRDIQLPPEYAKGLEGLLLKEQESDRMAVEVDIKQKMVRTAELEAEAEKARRVKQAEGEAQVVVLNAKAQADAMQHTLPLKQKQIEQTRLEAEARKEATVKNAEAMAQAKVIDSNAELEKRKLMTDAEANRIRVTAAADSERHQDGSGGPEGESAADSEDHRRAALRQGAGHDGADRRKVFLRQRCTEGGAHGKPGAQDPAAGPMTPTIHRQPLPRSARRAGR